MVKSDGGCNHDAEGDEGAEHVEECVFHAVCAVLFSPHENHRNHLQNGACRTDNRDALDAKAHFGGAQQNVGGDGCCENAGIQKCRDPHAFASVKAADEHGLQAKSKAYGQVPAENFRNRFGRFAVECATFKEDAHGREAECPHGDDCRNQDAEHAREALPNFAVELRKIAFLDEACHVGVARDADRETKDRDERVHDAVGVVEARNAARAKIRAKATDDKFKAEHGAHAKGHREHHLEITCDVGVLGVNDKFIMNTAALGSKNLECEKSDKCTDWNAPGKSCKTVIIAGVIREGKACGTAAHNGDVVDEAREGWNQELLAGVLDCYEDAPDENENLPWKNNATVVSRAFQELGSHAIDGQKRNEFLHPDEGWHYENQECKPERIQHVAEKFPAALFVTRDFVARENRDENDREEPGADHVIQDVWNHEGEVKSVFFERHAGGVGEEHFAEDAEHAANEHAHGDNNSGFIHGHVKYRML